MTDLFDYIEWRGDLPLTAVPLCDVDALLFARLSYMPFEGVVPTGFDHEKPLPDAARQLLAKAQSSFVNFRTLEDKRLLEKLLDAPRYKGLALCGYETEYDKENEEQFAALTIRLPLGLCVAFPASRCITGARNRCMHRLWRDVWTRCILPNNDPHAVGVSNPQLLC